MIETERAELLEQTVASEREQQMPQRATLLHPRARIQDVLHEAQAGWATMGPLHPRHRLGEVLSRLPENRLPGDGVERVRTVDL